MSRRLTSLIVPCESRLDEGDRTRFGMERYETTT